MSEPRLLIVEGDVLVRHSIAQYLRECGYLVLEAVNTEEARLILNENRVPGESDANKPGNTRPIPAGNAIDIVLADTDAPGENGFALAEWIRATFPAIDVVLAGTISAAAQKAGHLCAEGTTITKPYDHAHLLDRIKRLRAARDRRSHSPSLA